MILSSKDILKKCVLLYMRKLIILLQFHDLKISKTKDSSVKDQSLNKVRSKVSLQRGICSNFLESVEIHGKKMDLTFLAVEFFNKKIRGEI